MTPRLEFRPMSRWDAPDCADRKSTAQFRVKWPAIRSQLLSEADMLGAPLVVIQLVIDPADLRQDGQLRANARTSHPGAKVSFRSSSGPLTFATDIYERIYSHTLPGWQGNVRAIGLGMAALRAVDRYGITQSGQQYQGFTPLDSKPFGHGEMTVDEAITTLLQTGGGTDVTREELLSGELKFINAAFRSSARRWHPDVSGNESVFKTIAKAREVLLAAAGR